MKTSIKDFFSKCDQIDRFLRIWSHLLNKSLMENYIFCAVKLSIPLFCLQKRNKFCPKNAERKIDICNFAYYQINTETSSCKIQKAYFHIVYAS